MFRFRKKSIERNIINYEKIKILCRKGLFTKTKYFQFSLTKSPLGLCVVSIAPNDIKYVIFG